MAIELTRTATSVKWGGNSVDITPQDQCVASTADKAVYIASPQENGFKVVSYAPNGKVQGECEYKNKTLTRLFSRSGKGSMVYCCHEKGGKKTWYQADLTPNGYCTDVYALHRTDSNGKIIPFVDDDDSVAEEETRVVETKLSADAIIADLDKPKATLSLDKNKPENTEDGEDA